VRTVRITVDLSAIRKNFRIIRRLLDPAVGITAVVKAEAYGHGLIETARVLEEEKADMLGVAYLEEGILLRAAGIRSPILVMCGLRGTEEAREALEHNLIPTLFDLESMRSLSQVARSLGIKASFLIKIDTGMGRLGIPWSRCKAVIEEASAIEGLKLEGVVSHLSNADEADDDFSLLQLSRFREALSLLGRLGLGHGLSSIANSAGLLRYPQCRLNMVRPGISLYGYSFDQTFQRELRPAMSIAGKILQTKELEAGRPVSYGRTFYTSGPSRIAVASGGYGEGLPRAMSNKAFALVGGKRVPVIGTVCMDMTILDISGMERPPAPGEEVVYVGRQGDASIGAHELARWAGTISYEVLCSAGQRHKREYIDEEKDNLGPSRGS
jgi:alanine racemase